MKSLAQVFISWLLLLLGLLATHFAFAQCCTPGNPIGGAVNPGVSQTGIWQLFVGYRYGYSGEYFEESQPIEAYFVASGAFQHLSLAMTYGLSERLTLEAESGYFLAKTQAFVPGILPASLRGVGFTDLNILARINLWQNPISGWELTSALGFKLPLGSYQQTQDGILLPRDLQPSTGSMDALHTVFFQKVFLAQKFRLFALSRLEWKGQNPDQYRYGHFWSLGAFASYSPHFRWTLVAQLRNEWRGRDSRPLTGQGIPLGNGREQIIPTGSNRLYASPQIGFEASPRLQLTALVDLPLYQRYNGQQLGTSFGLWLNLRYRWADSRTSNPIGDR